MLLAAVTVYISPSAALQYVVVMYTSGFLDDVMLKHRIVPLRYRGMKLHAMLHDLTDQANTHFE